jgi:signal transduction histidine kinase
LRQQSIRTGRLASLGELAAGVAHEINNPNALILYNADLVCRCYGDAAPILQDFFEQHGDFFLGGIAYSEIRFELPHLFSEMFDGANRIKRIVDDLKNFVRHEGLGFELTERVNLNEVVKAAVRLINSTIKKSTDSFEVVYADDLPPFCGSFQRIEQVVINLIMNACQALAAKDRSIRATTWYDLETEQIVLRLCDQGVGIASGDLPHIMEPFFTTKREHGGTGLGLSVTSRIVREHKGSLEFQSVSGQGTTVSLYLPISPEEMCHA